MRASGGEGEWYREEGQGGGREREVIGGAS